MNIDPVKEWQRLTQLYGEMSDQALQELAVDFNDLTETAQQVLQEELQRRKLTAPEKDKPLPKIPAAEESHSSPDDPEPEGNPPWILRENGDARILGAFQELLDKAGIPSRVVLPQDNFYAGRFPQLQVKEEDAVRAEETLALPLEVRSQPQSVEEAENFELPICPHCGASDPLLESVEPFNTWLCESCGNRWTEAADGFEQPSSAP